jgi:Uma2 family endonuclease
MSAEPIQFARHKLTVLDYHRMADVGILAPDARVELIEGEIIDMAPIGSRHCSVVDKLSRLLDRAVGEQAIVRTQGAVRLNRYTEPQPDIALLKYRDDFYAAAHPAPEDILLAVEVADSTLPYDHQVKAPLYARAGIAEYWLFDLEHQEVIFHSAPDGGQYKNINSTPSPKIVAIGGLRQISVDLSSVL